MSLAEDILLLADNISGELVPYRETTTWYDGSPINDSKTDGDIFRKKDGIYYRKTIDEKTLLKIDSIVDLRLQNGYYEGQEISLLGYYQSGDKKLINYKFTIENFSTNTDDGGSIIKSSRGSWIAQFNRKIDVKDFGCISDGAFDNGDNLLRITSYLNSVVPSETNRFKLTFPISNNYFKTTKAVNIPAYVELEMKSPLLGSGVTTTLLTIGSSDLVNIKTNLEINVRSEAVNWTDIAYEGFRVISSNSSFITVIQTVGFRFGGTFIGVANGFSYNEIRLGQLSNNRIDLKLTNFQNGWINENSFFGGRFQRTNSTNPGQDKYNVLITSEDGIYINNNNNNFYKPSFENAYTGVGDMVPIVIQHGVQNAFYDVRMETGNVPCLIRTLNASTDNVVEVGFISTVSYTYDRSVQDLGTYPTTIIKARKGGVNQQASKYLVYDSGDLSHRLFTKDNTDTYAPDELFISNSSNSTIAKNNTGITIIPSSNNVLGSVTFPTTRGIGVRVDTSKSKRFVVNKQILTGGNAGRVIIRCYDSSGNVLTNVKTLPDTTVIAYSYVKGEATTIPVYSSNFGGVYRMGSDADANFYINLDSDVKSIDVILGGGTSTLQIRSFSITALDFPTSIINMYNRKGWYSSTIPTTTIYEVGTIAYNTVQLANKVSGWIYNGTAWVELVPDIQVEQEVTVLNIDDITKYISQYSSTNVRGAGYIYFGGNVNAAKSNNTTSVTLDSTGITFGTTRACVTTVDTILSKTFKVNTVTSNSATTRIGVRCFDSLGLLIDSTSPTIPVTTLDGTNFTWSENFKMWVSTLGNELNFKLNTIVAKIDSIITPSTASTIKLEAFKITAYNDEARMLDKYSENLLATALPTITVKEGTFYYNINTALKVHGWIYIGSAWVEVPKFNQSTAVLDVTATSSSSVSIADLTSISTADATIIATGDATDATTTQALVNELKAKINSLITLVNEEKSKINLGVTMSNDIKSKYNISSTLGNANKTTINSSLATERTSGQRLP